MKPYRLESLSADGSWREIRALADGAQVWQLWRDMGGNMRVSGPLDAAHYKVERLGSHWFAAWHGPAAEATAALAASEKQGPSRLVPSSAPEITEPFLPPGTGFELLARVMILGGVGAMVYAFTLKTTLADTQLPDLNAQHTQTIIIICGAVALLCGLLMCLMKRQPNK